MTWAAGFTLDTNRPDCGMEVVRWLCAEPRGHVESTQFIVHTHNAAAARSMLVSLRDRGYLSVYRPFGVDLDDWFARRRRNRRKRKGRISTPRPLLWTRTRLCRASYG